MNIVSGGQTGADRGGLEAGLALGLPIGGWCPKGRRAEDGRIPDRYPLFEHESPAYLPRTEQNVIDSHGTIVFTIGKPTTGSFQTVRFAIIHLRPVLSVELDSEEDPVTTVANWLVVTFGDRITNDPELTINIAGNRESRAPGIEQKVRDVLGVALTLVLGGNKHGIKTRW